jgi:DNA-binding transcriptional LysR family regulator
MQDLDWDDLRYILCLSRTGRIAGAARKLGVNETTVARRIARVEGMLGVRMFERDAGVLRPTDSGQIVVRRAERIELDVDAVKRRRDQRRQCCGRQSARNSGAVGAKLYSDPRIAGFAPIAHAVAARTCSRSSQS